MPETDRIPTGYSPQFLAEVVKEIARLEKRIERLKSPAAKDRVSAERAVQAGYLRFLREKLLR